MVITDRNAVADISFMGSEKSKAVPGVILLKGSWWVVQLITFAFI